MIKIKAKYDENEDCFKAIKFKLDNSCNMEVLCVISELIDNMIKHGEVEEKEVFKMMKEFYQMWKTTEKER